MNRAFEILKQPRQMILGLLSNLTIEQVNKIPEGFNNNIIWNLGHMIATSQGLCYKRSGLPITVSDDFFKTYASGSKPERFITEAEYNEIKELLITTLESMDADYKAGKFVDYDSIVTRYNVEISNIDEAIGFLPFHDGLHVGYIMKFEEAGVTHCPTF